MPYGNEIGTGIQENITEFDECGQYGRGPNLEDAGSCEKCPKARMLSGDALKVLLQNCPGLKVVTMGCEDALVCDSPDLDAASLLAK
jgi:hypothetical protein